MVFYIRQVYSLLKEAAIGRNPLEDTPVIYGYLSYSVPNVQDIKLLHYIPSETWYFCAILCSHSSRNKLFRRFTALIYTSCLQLKPQTYSDHKSCYSANMKIQHILNCMSGSSWIEICAHGRVVQAEVRICSALKSSQSCLTRTWNPLPRITDHRAQSVIQIHSLICKCNKLAASRYSTILRCS